MAEEGFETKLVLVCHSVRYTRANSCFIKLTVLEQRATKVIVAINMLEFGYRHLRSRKGKTRTDIEWPKTG